MKQKMLPTTLSVHFLLTWKNLTFLPCKITLIPFVEIKLQKIPSRIPKSKLSNWILMEYKIHTWDPFGATSCRAGPEATPQGSYYITHAMGPIFKTVLEYVPKKYFVYEKRVSCFKICIAPCIPRDRHIHHVYLVYERGFWCIRNFFGRYIDCTSWAKLQISFRGWWVQWGGLL